MTIRQILIMAFLVESSSFLAAAPPATEKKPVTDTYHNNTIVDPYRWLEDGKSKETQAWSDAQNKHARDYLDKLPGRDKIRDRVKELLASKTIRHFNLQWREGQLFAMKSQPPKEHPFLVVMPSPQEPEKAKTIVDPTVFDPSGKTSIDLYVASPDGKLVAVSLSKAGSEAGDVHIFETATGKQVDVVIPRVQNGTAGGDVAWMPDSRGFFYTRYPRGKEKPAEDMDFYQQLYYHELGTPTEKDRYELGKDFPRIAEIRLFMHNPSGKLLVSVQDGDGGEFSHFVRSTDGKFKQFAGFKDRAIQALWAKGSVLVVSRDNAPRGKLVRLDDDLDLKSAKEIVPQGQAAIVTDFYGKPTLVATDSRVYITYQTGGPSQVMAYDLEGAPSLLPNMPPVSSASELTPLDRDNILIGIESFVEPFAHYVVSHTGPEPKLVKTPLTTAPPVEFKDIEVRREFATSKDGTKVPISIMIPKGAKLDGSDPCLVTGYGGYGISIDPNFSAIRRLYFDHGFIMAVVNLRGGSEFGEEWHHQGRLLQKQNVFDDFAAALDHLSEKKYTSPAKLAIEGGSNGGLLMGAMVTQSPGLMHTVVSHVGIYDMLRVELSPNGAFNVPEFGTVKDYEQFKALRAYSPYHNVRDGVKFPAILFLTGANDPRVDPMQSRKMTARLQAAAASQAPILLRTSSTSGHGAGTALSEKIEQVTDVAAFLFAQLGIKAK